jgi:hypothetical protein
MITLSPAVSASVDLIYFSSQPQHDRSLALRLSRLMRPNRTIIGGDLDYLSLSLFLFVGLPFRSLLEDDERSPRQAIGQF